MNLLNNFPKIMLFTVLFGRKAIQNVDFASKSAVLIGNESNGISSSLSVCVDEKIYIPTKTT